MTEPFDEFAWIDRLRPLARGDARALGLLDDVSVIPGRPGFDLVVSKDAMVEGVHFLPGAEARNVARRLLRTSLSDLAAKAAEPFGYFLMTAWPGDRASSDREAFIDGLAADGAAFGVALLGGDTVRTPGPLTLSATVLGWVRSGRAVLRSTAKAGDSLIVCGVIGDGWLGLKAALGEVPDPTGRLIAHFHAPLPLLALRPLLERLARAAADVSDGLVADAFHLARASGLGLAIDLAAMPLSAPAEAWCSEQTDFAHARLALATGGDDYAIVCAVDPAEEAIFIQEAAALNIPAARVGVFTVGDGRSVAIGGRRLRPGYEGYRH